MALNPNHASMYIRAFAEQVRTNVRQNLPPNIYSLWITRIQEDLSEITKAEVKHEALQHLGKIRRYGAIYVEDPEGSRAGIATEINGLADLISKI